MKNLRISVSLLLLSAIFITYSALEAVAQKKPWTFLVYIAAANNLNEFASLDIDEMKKVGSNENINILVYETLQFDGQPKTTNRLFVEKGKVTVVHKDAPMDSGSRDTLLQAMQWALVDYPSDHIAVVLWNHGSGPLNRCPSWMRGICYDDATGSFLTDVDCKYVFEKVVKDHRGGKKLDIVACDACLMANIEVAHALQSSANYFVASQETIPGEGYDYAGALAQFNDGSVDPEFFARAMIAAYGKEYSGQTDWTLSLLDLGKLTPLTQATNQIGDLLTSFIAKDKTKKLRKIIGVCASSLNTVHFSEQTYIDLYGFYKALIKYLATMPISSLDKKRLSAAVSQAMRAYNACVLDNVHSADLRNARGLSVYFPNKAEGIESSYPLIYWSRTTNWLKFLKAYLKVK